MLRNDGSLPSSFPKASADAPELAVTTTFSPKYRVPTFASPEFDRTIGRPNAATVCSLSYDLDYAKLRTP